MWLRVDIVGAVTHQWLVQGLKKKNFNFFCSSVHPSSPLAALIGRDILADRKAKLVLTHKLILVRVPSNPSAAHNLLGYLAGSIAGRELLGKSLQSVLEVWSDATAIRHMDARQHLWISRVLVLGVVLMVAHKEWAERKTSEWMATGRWQAFGCGNKKGREYNKDDQFVYTSANFNSNNSNNNHYHHSGNSAKQAKLTR